MGKNIKEFSDISNAKSDTEISDRLLKYLAAVSNPYLFQINGINVKVVFSKKPNAPTIESALVKIAAGRLD